MAAPLPQPEESAAAFARVARGTDRDVLRILADAYEDIGRDLARIERSSARSAAIRRNQLLAVRGEILARQGEIFARIGDVVSSRRAEAAAAAIEVSGRYDSAVFGLLGRSDEARALTAALQETELRTVDAAVARVTGSATSLSVRVYRTEVFASGILERRINSALARGLNAQEFAREIREFVNPRVPGGQRYAALRLARTEINNAYHAMAIRAAELKPWVDKIRWNLSASHVHKDKCNALGGREFAPADTPRKPHPMCLCYITPVVADTQADEDAFLDGLADGDFDDFLDSFGARHGVAPIPVAVTGATGGNVIPIRGRRR